MEEMEETGVTGTEMEDIVAHITIVCQTIPSSLEEKTTEQNAEVEEGEYVGFKDQSYGCGKIGGYRKED